MFTNRHVIIAMIMAPILAALAWISAGQFTGEQAAPARPGQSYPLVARAAGSSYFGDASTSFLQPGNNPVN